MLSDGMEWPQNLLGERHCVWIVLRHRENVGALLWSIIALDSFLDKLQIGFVFTRERQVVFTLRL